MGVVYTGHDVYMHSTSHHTPLVRPATVAGLSWALMVFDEAVPGDLTVSLATDTAKPVTKLPPSLALGAKRTSSCWLPAETCVIAGAAGIPTGTAAALMSERGLAWGRPAEGLGVGMALRQKLRQTVEAEVEAEMHGSV
jgi:hypothetical protein